MRQINARAISMQTEHACYRGVRPTAAV